MSKNSFPIKSVEFQVFYRKLRQKFIDNIHDGKPPKGNVDSPAVWDAKNKDGQYHATLLFGGGRTEAHRYFYRKHSELQPEQKHSGVVDNGAFLRGLEYIGIALPSELNKASNRKKVEALFSIFKEQHREEIKNEEENIIVANPYPKLQGEDFLYPEALNSNLTAAKYTVQRFYENIASSNFEDAWNLMSPELQNKRPWLGEYERFRTGYTNTNTLRNIVVFNINQTVPNVIDCRVFYDDEIAAHTRKELSSLDTLTVEDIDVFVTHVKKLSEIFKSKGLDGFEKIELHKLFEPSASEYIWYRSNFPADKLHELFTVQKSIIVKRVYDCSCGYYDDKWLINNINAMKTYSAR